MTLAIATITNSIAALSVTGLDILDTDELTEKGDVRQAMIIPRPDGFVTSWRLVRDSQGSNSTVVAKYTVTYRLTYRLLYKPVGVDRGLFSPYPAMVSTAFAFLDAVLSNDAITGAVDVTPAEITSFGPVSDPAGNMYHGCDIMIDVMEFVG